MTTWAAVSGAFFASARLVSLPNMLRVCVPELKMWYVVAVAGLRCTQVCSHRAFADGALVPHSLSKSRGPAPHGS